MNSSTHPDFSAAPRRAVSDLWPCPLASTRVHATVRVPGSKSETNRALVLAAISDGPSTVYHGLQARDSELMIAGLRTLGVRIETGDDGWVVHPPLQFNGTGVIDCGLAGTVMRFLPPLAAVGRGQFGFAGDPRAAERPLRPLLDALADMGADLPDDAVGLPFMLNGRPDLPGGPIIIDAHQSSQFVSALLLAAPTFAQGLDLRHVGPPIPSQPHIDMTVAMLRDRGVVVDTSTENRWIVAPGPVAARDITVEPDLSNAAAFLAAAAVTGGTVVIPDWPRHTAQPGDRIRDILSRFGADVHFEDDGLHVTGGLHLHGVDHLDLSEVSELTPVVAAVAALSEGSTRIHGVGHIRGHETDRLAALDEELSNLGCRVVQHDDGLTIHPKLLHGGVFRTYADHRMAHCAAVLGLVVDDITIDDIGCTTKTMPEFPDLWWQMVLDSENWVENQ